MSEHASKCKVRISGSIPNIVDLPIKIEFIH
jgi:hypothetical protein